MAKEHMKKFLKSYVIREMQTKIMRYHYPSIKIDKIWNTNTKCSGDVAQERSFTAGENTQQYRFSFLQSKAYCYHMVQQLHLIFTHRNKKLISTLNPHTDIYSSFITTGKTWKRPRCPSVGSWMNKLW